MVILVINPAGQLQTVPLSKALRLKPNKIRVLKGPRKTEAEKKAKERERKHRYHIENRDRILTYQKEWRELKKADPEWVKKKNQGSREYYRNRWETDPDFREHERLRNRKNYHNRKKVKA
jgi:hypothetical protein